MSEISPLELWTRKLLGSSRIVGDEVFGSAMLARAVSKLGEADRQFQNQFLAALTDALMGRDPFCDLKVVRSGKRGQPGKGGVVASSQEFELAADVRRRCDKAKLGPAAEPEAQVLREYMDRYGIASVRRAKKHLTNGQNAFAAIRDGTSKRRAPPNS